MENSRTRLVDALSGRQEVSGVMVASRELRGRVTPMSEAGEADSEILIERVVDARREVVFALWTDPGQVDGWWGGEGFTVTTLEMDVRAGGVWRYVMRGPDGREYPNQVVFEHVIPPHGLSYAHGRREGERPDFHAAVTFVEREGRTAVTLRMIFPTKAARDRVVAEHGVARGQQALARFAERVSHATERPFTTSSLSAGPA